MLKSLLLLLVLTLPLTADAPSDVFKQDFQKLPVGPLPDEIMVVDGAFTIELEGENHVLQIGTEPLTEGAVLLGKSVKNGGTIKAKIKASSKRRSFPRLGVGLGGTSGYRFRINPADKTVEFIKEDAQVAKADFTWKSDVWYWLEFNITNPDGKWLLEGRAWEEGQPRPAAASLAFTTDAAPSNGKASLWGAPFSMTPIQFDDVEITPGK